MAVQDGVAIPASTSSLLVAGIDRSSGKAQTLGVTSTGGLTADGAAITSSTVTQVASSLSSVTLLAANSSRRAFSVYNDSTGTLFVKCGGSGAASLTSFTVALGPKGTFPGGPGGFYESLMNFTALIQGIWDAANGNAYVTEYLP